MGKKIDAVELFRNICRHAADDTVTLDDVEGAIESCEDYDEEDDENGKTD